MKNITFYQLDVFAEQQYFGNQLAVFRAAEDLSSEEMQLITREMNYSETTFILSDRKNKGGYDVRIFTPQHEVPFAGHPTLGTAFVINQEIDSGHEERILLNLKVGQIPVSFFYLDKEVERLEMKQNQPTFHETYNKDLIAKALNLSPLDIDPGFPIQGVSTGLPFIITPLMSLDAVKRAVVNKDIFFSLIEKTEAKAILVFSPETYGEENDINARVFVDYYGIPEDPATGSGNGCLAAYLVANRFFGQDAISLRVEQGYEIGRPSILTLKAKKKGDAFDIQVGGKVILVAKGELYR
ncbi:MAG: PhzF family phenazine biosynthesis protein [Candidatus Aminicenantes bacterium]|nr:PhzF family phenazine biosynthesis protein [Candidatus Aminicenantes bacterium]